MGWFSKKRAKTTRATQATASGRSRATTARPEHVYPDLSLDRPGITPRTAEFESPPPSPPRRTVRWRMGKMWADIKDAHPGCNFDYGDVRAAHRRALQQNSLGWADQSGMPATGSRPRPPVTNRHWAPSESSSSRGTRQSSLNTGSLRSWLNKYSEGYPGPSQQQPTALPTPKAPTRRIYETKHHARPQNLQSRGGPFFSSNTRAPTTTGTSKATATRAASTVRPHQSNRAPSQNTATKATATPASNPPRTVSQAKTKSQGPSTAQYHSPQRTLYTAASSHALLKTRKPSSGYPYAFA